MSFPNLLNQVHHLIDVLVLVDDELWTDESVFGGTSSKLELDMKWSIVLAYPPAQATEVVRYLVENR